jgi:hypothetical protein
MTYDVLVSELRAAAGRYRTVADSLGTDAVEITHLDPTSFGHIELAAWVKAVADQCDKATTALHDGATGLAESLDASAHYYESTDQDVASRFTPPFSTPSSPPFSTPFSTPFSSPFSTTPPAGTP